MRTKPTIVKKDRAKTLIDGWRCTKSPIDLAAINMTATDTKTAAIMIDISSTNPTAVITLSRENTISKIPICITEPQNNLALFEFLDVVDPFR